ncbi:hypothetical protein [Geodermatophilus sp. SYSU D00079]
MTPEPTSPRAASVLISGAATTLYYATPDFISSRTARGWAKAGLVALSLAVAVPDVRAAWATAREPQQLDGEAVPPVTPGPPSTGGKVLAIGAGAAALALTVRGVVAAERWAFRRGEARAAAGKPLPHTGPALLYGALTSALWLLPTPLDAR